MTREKPTMDRRTALSGIASGCAAVGLTGAAPPVGAATASAGLIARENAQPGSRNWLLTNTRIDPATRYRCPWVEGYASHTSLAPGETLRLMISTLQPNRVLVEIFRLGFYGGEGGRQLAEFGPLPTTPQPTPAPGELRLMDCGWETSHEVPVEQDWPSGVYVAKLTEQLESLQSYIIFIVKDARPVDLLFQCSTNTWQAYNRWPSQYSLYDDGQQQWYWGGDSQVGFHRPYGKYCQILDAPLSIGSGEFFLWEFPFVYWLEAQGYDVSYVSNEDTHTDAASVQRGRGWLSVGHDEYWTIDMYRHVEQAIAAGVSVGFFSGNAVCGKVLWNSKTRAIRRVGVFGPPGGTREFESMSSLPHEPPYANQLIGAHSTGPVTGGADWICTAPDHWLYEQTGMAAGDRVPGLIGWEYHGDPAPLPGLEIVASGPTQSAPGQLNGGVYTATVYPGPHGNLVFNAATCWWADGLSAPPGYQSPSVYTSPQGVDSRVQQMTRNVLARMLQG